jgi:hypothetical protein
MRFTFSAKILRVTATVSPTLSPPPSISVTALARLRLRAYVRTVAVVDTLVITIATTIGYLGRFAETDGPVGQTPSYGLVGPLLVVGWLLSLRFLRCYDPRVLGYGAEEYRHVLQASLRLAGFVAISGYVLNHGISRVFLGITFASGTVGLLCARWIGRQALHRARGLPLLVVTWFSGIVR